MTVSSTAPTPLNRPEFAAMAAETGAPTAIAAESDGKNFWGEDGFTFGDLIDLINPLHHIPIVGTIYRALTGDQIAPGARMAGGVLYGGALGLGAAVVAQIVEESTGKDPGAHIMATLTGDGEDDTAAPTQLAQAGPAAPSASPTEATSGETTEAVETAAVMAGEPAVAALLALS